MTSFKKYLTVLSVLSLVAIGIYAGIFYHLYTIERSSNVLEQEVKVLKQSADEQYSLRALETEIADDVLELEKAIVGKEGQVDMITYIESLARENNMYISILGISERELAGFNALDFKLIGEGTWNQTMTLLEKLQNMPYHADIERVQLERIDSYERYDPDAVSSFSQVPATAGTLAPTPPQTSTVRASGPGWRLAVELYVLKNK